MKILVINGPNLNLLGRREPELYGRQTYEDLEKFIHAEASALGLEAEIIQTNHEGAIIDAVQTAAQNFEALIINPAAYTHTSIAIADAIAAAVIPCAEVHLTDPGAREEFRRVSYIRPYCAAVFKGMGFRGYGEALKWAKLRAKP